MNNIISIFHNILINSFFTKQFIMKQKTLENVKTNKIFYML